MRKVLLFVMLLAFVLPAVRPSHAQGDEIVLQLAIPGYMEDMFNQGLLDQFEAEHPGVRVDLVTSGGSGMMVTMGGGQQDIDSMLDDMEERASSADVLAVGSSDLTPETTRAGYFLDLSPLVNSDASLNTDDFYPAVWDSFQWDGGIWGIPAAADPILVFYDRAAFDAAGLPYPDTWQSIEDVELAIRTLTKLDADGEVTKLGFMNMGGDLGQVVLSLLNQPLYDESVIPNAPRFSSPELEHLLTVWAQMQADGLFDPPISTDDDGPMMVDVPIQISRGMFSLGPLDETPNTPALLPGGRVGLNVDGFAVSRGTQYPEEAYELVKFLTNNAQVSSAFLDSSPARRSLVGVQTEGAGIEFGGQVSPELETLVPVALENAISLREARFSDYLYQAVEQMARDNLDVTTALQNLETSAYERLQAADERGASVVITVTPPPELRVPDGEIVLNFNVSSLMPSLPNQAEWDAFIADFAARDPQVGLVNLESGMYGSLNELTDRYDCFTTSNNVVPTGDLSLLRSLDPLLGTDPTYDANDMVSGVMDQVRRDGQIWALPLALEPLAMRYNPDVFAQAGAATPSMNWTVDEFELALRALKPNPDDPTPFAPGGVAGDTHLLMLIAAYGGLPIDYRTTPPTINFTDPATVAAIRQVLDLAKNDYIDYSTLVTAGGMVSIAVSSESENPIPLYTTTLNGLGGFGGAIAMSDGGSIVIPDNTDPLILFPQGTTYTGLSYDLTAAYINANTPATDACYRFISELASHPELFPAMPVRQSLINSPEVAAEQGENMVAFYNALAALMQRPDSIEFPSAMTFDLSALGTNMITMWLDRAFDRYINEDADLETELTEAQTYTTAFQECTAAIPPLTPDQDFGTYYQQFIDCALRVDPSTSELFPQ